MSDRDDINNLIDQIQNIQLPDSSDEEDVDIIPNNNLIENLNNNQNMANQFNEFYLKTIPEFDGEPCNVSTFLNACNLVMNQFYNANNPNLYLNHFLLSYIQSKLTGRARAIVSTKHITNWNELRAVLTNNFSDQREDSTLLSELLTLKQRNNEDALSFSNRCRQIEQLLVTNLSINEDNEATKVIKRNIYSQQTLKAFLGGLRNPLGMVVRSTNPATIEAALRFIISEENYDYRDSMINKNKFHNNNSNKNPPRHFFERPHVPPFQPVQFQRPFPIYNPPKPFPFRSDIPRIPHPRLQQQNYQRPQNFPRAPSSRIQNYPQPMEVDISTRTRSTRNNPQQRNNYFRNQNPRRPDFISEELHNIEHQMPPSEAYDIKNQNFPVAGPSRNNT